ncbi:glutamine synthetase [Fadolivirus algeromassiliense]|jgi:glutamine synthetase|uniref:glutamine synthetase n=1 Tax=Fadolivirus FV1/VV64 TaxID=3070911 RepID=A0A7D3V8W6_9VIRU|nr:glutamine synthetase [Fadolivirus algeromassiliense]QKF94157.1 glutamine synthetase [Fadolivirus FV1/VV64]
MSVVVEYIWIDADGNTRSKARTLLGRSGLVNVSDVPTWNFDGSSTNQAVGKDSETILIPVALYKDPFRINFPVHCYLVLCECYDRYGNALNSNTRQHANDIFNTDVVASSHLWYGIEQEYVLYDNKTKRILGWPLESEPESQGKYYCGVGADRTFGREIVEEHYRLCLLADLKMSGINEEVLPGQWEYQIGPCEGIDAGDQLWISRYILHRVCEKYNVTASFAPKPVKGDWNGSGLHTNFSTAEMRTEHGLDKIYEAIDKIEKNHKELIKYCGDNSERLTGTHETSKLDHFTWGVADRTASVRIPSQVNDVKSGYLEYRVPAADADPYQITSMIAKIILL